MEVEGYESFFQELSKLVEHVQYRDEDNEDQLSELEQWLQFSVNHLLYFQQVLKCSNEEANIDELTKNVQLLLHEVRRDFRKVSNRQLAIFNIDRTVSCAGPGRPKIEIHEESLLYFRNIGFTWKDISELFLVSRWTVWRRVKELGIEKFTGYSDINDDELDSIVLKIKNDHGSLVGRSLVLGHLKSMGIKVQQRRVNKSLIRVDPESSRGRWAALIKRRKYKVPAPNSLWHVDGYHALITWGFVIHGAIDGFSRYIVFLHCSTNNRKETVLKLFDEATVKNGTPSRIRTDKGGENTLIWNRMVERRGENRGSYIAGSSVHNQRIERLWRDVWNSVAHQFYYVFQAMEIEGLLDREDQRKMYILHYIYLPRINHTIYNFVSGWNNHPLRTEKNWSPIQLWTNGVIDRRNSYLPHIALIQENLAEDEIDWFGIDWNGPAPNYDDEIPWVELDDIESPLSEFEKERLHSINPLSPSPSFGTDLFVEALKRVENHY